jgi:hypothetical protein
MKTLTRKELARRKAQAVRFTRDVLGDEARAEEIEDESPAEYAERRRIRIQNRSRGARTMPTPTRRELLERIEELESENEELHSQLDQIADIVGPDEGEEEETEDDDQGEE